VEEVHFSSYSQPRKIREKPGVKHEHEGFLLLRDKSASTPLYTLKKPVQVQENSDFFLSYSLPLEDASLEISVSGRDEPARIDLPPNEGKPTEFHVPLEEGTEITKFTVRSLSGRALGRIYEAGISPSSEGLSFVQDKIVQEQGFTFSVDGSNGKPFLNVDLTETDGRGFILSGYDPWSGLEEDEENPLIYLQGYSEEENTAVQLFPWKGGKILYFFPGLAGFSPQEVSIPLGPDGTGGITIRKIPEERPPWPEPLAVDFSTVLYLSKEFWRNESFEVFSWAEHPEILIFDTADYSVQASMLKRIAFFIEKQGYTGKLWTNEDLEKKHGWNAHDYRAEDLARFFTLVEETGFRLNSEEILLRQILLNHGILSESQDVFTPGEGGFLSISRESPGYLREKFITHEGLHGLFFSDPEYRSACGEIFNSLPEEGKEFWQYFFTWMAYNADDPYLVVNEYQAYMLQQSVSSAEDYFRNHPAFSSLSEEIKDFLEENPRFFEESARKMEALLEKHLGFPAGRLFCFEI